MKKVIFTLFSAALLINSASAQYCGNSGTSVCTPSGTQTEPGLSPNSEDLPPVENGVATTTVIQFKNFNTFNLAGQTVTVQSLKIDSIENLPAGTCWATNKANNTFGNQEDGCIKVTGTACTAPGQYKLRIKVIADVGFGGIPTDAETAGLSYYVRVVNQGQSAPAVDTNQTAAFVAYGNPAVCANSVNDEFASTTQLNVVPNPMNSTAVVTFNSVKSGMVTERLTNMLGSEIIRNTLEVKAGANTSVINRNNLPAGVYFYSISDGKHVATKRVVISE